MGFSLEWRLQFCRRDSRRFGVRRAQREGSYQTAPFRRVVPLNRLFAWIIAPTSCRECHASANMGNVAAKRRAHIVGA